MIKRSCAIATLVVFLVSLSFAQSEINIIPKPRSLERRAGSFELTKKTLIVASKSDEDTVLTRLLNDRLQGSYGFKLDVVSSTPPKGNFIKFYSQFNDPPLLPEQYNLIVDGRSITLDNSSASGRFYALQTLLQLLPARATEGKVMIPNVVISDQPRFQYRGMHLDVARHFMPVSFVKRYIDLLAQYKFNQFHWHLTDDQGWRIEIKKYPKLTEIGSKRPESHEGVYSTVFKGDSRPVEGFYTQEEIKDVVAYAKARYINVIPEIELPGHASAALAAYPELGRGCAAPDYKFEVKKTWGIFKEVFCPTEETFKFLDEVLDETINLFPDSPYIHIGGDEVLKDFWKESPYVQELKKRENLKDEHEVQSYFVRRMEKFVNSKGKKIIGWDEILEGGIAPNATIMSWRGMKGGIEAAKAKHDVIMTPTDFAYLDYGQGDPAYELLNIGGYLPLEKVYQFDPVPKELTAEEAKYVIGGQANIWTEYMETGDKVEYMAFPRMLAIAESVWSTPENKNFADFKRRLYAQLPLLDRQNVNYRIPEPEGLKNVIVGSEKTLITLSPVAGTKVYYTLDGSTPDERSTLYTKPIEIALGDNGSRTLKTVVQIPTGRKSVVYAATIVRGPVRAPVKDVGENKPGVKYEFFIPRGDMSGEGERRTGESRSIFLTQFAQSFDLAKNFAVTYDGFIKVSETGVYEFWVDSTWDATVVVGSEMVVNQAGTKDRSIKSGVLPLEAGWHKISIRYNHRGGEAHFRVRFGQKGHGLRQIGGGELVH